MSRVVDNSAVVWATKSGRQAGVLAAMSVAMVAAGVFTVTVIANDEGRGGSLKILPGEAFHTGNVILGVVGILLGLHGARLALVAARKIPVLVATSTRGRIMLISPAHWPPLVIMRQWPVSVEVVDHIVSFDRLFSKPSHGFQLTVHTPSRSWRWRMPYRPDPSDVANLQRWLDSRSDRENS